jgi:hypothetical protein
MSTSLFFGAIAMLPIPMQPPIHAQSNSSGSLYNYFYLISPTIFNAMSDFEGWRTSTKVSDQLREPRRVGHREPDFECKWNGVRDCLFGTEQSRQRPTLVLYIRVQIT